VYEKIKYEKMEHLILLIAAIAHKSASFNCDILEERDENLLQV
jgi:hypothetical protein